MNIGPMPTNTKAGRLEIIANMYKYLGVLFLIAIFPYSVLTSVGSTVLSSMVVTFLNFQ